MSTYRLTVKRRNQPDLVRTGLDKLNATVIPVELQMAFPKAFKSGYMSVEVTKENE